MYWIRSKTSCQFSSDSLVLHQTKFARPAAATTTAAASITCEAPNRIAAPVYCEALGLAEIAAATVDVGFAATEFGNAVEKTGSTLNAKVVSLAKVMDVKGSLLVEVAPSNWTRSDLGVFASRSARSKGTSGLRTLQILLAEHIGGESRRTYR